MYFNFNYCNKVCQVLWVVDNGRIAGAYKSKNSTQENILVALFGHMWKYTYTHFTFGFFIQVWENAPALYAESFNNTISNEPLRA